MQNESDKDKVGIMMICVQLLNFKATVYDNFYSHVITVTVKLTYGNRNGRREVVVILSRKRQKLHLESQQPCVRNF
jgi:hypothetical protein